MSHLTLKQVVRQESEILLDFIKPRDTKRVGIAIDTYSCSLNCAEIDEAIDKAVQQYGIDPKDADICITGDEGSETLSVCFDIEVPTTDEDKENDRRKRFNNGIFPRVYKTAIANGHKRTGFNSYLLRQFADTTYYDLAVAGNWDRLTEYFKLSFIEKE